MTGFVCPRCGSTRITDGKCEYCGFIFERKKPETPTPQQEPEAAARNRNMIKCPDCGRMISRYASPCPHCGRPVPQIGASSSELDRRRHIIGTVLAVMVVIAIIIFAVAGWFRTNPTSMPNWLFLFVINVRRFFGLSPFPG